MKLAFLLLPTLISCSAVAQTPQKGKPEDTEVWKPVPKVVTATGVFTAPPSDAVVLFNGRDLAQWVSVEDRTKPAGWKVADGLLTVDKKTGNIETKQKFTNYQLHLEWRVPATIAGTGQVRGNSGLFLASLGKGDLGYELQILDSYQNQTYVNGMAGSIYKQFIPLANPTQKPGEWQSYDVMWTAPTFKADGALMTPARVTVLFNGVLVQNNTELKGATVYIGPPSYQAHGPSPIKLQSHGDPSEPISFRNIWVREL
ncbi:3-keto-disaccharide hydrolase [Hymenobacter puniceus]|uniref:3-keto-disaccharide hydrolase n=1 Tax=Hymenobacter sp. BT190 TaxID=2763505 RepID=UPI0016512903|nr:DUF1080 domain-containing protein [Hymenobacter sp. BT190]MBC6698281.1 DUF1080 domain-containing protein [Hymenobacter sp. BT190]